MLKRTRKSLYEEKNRLTEQLNKVDRMIAAFDGLGTGNGHRRKRKMSAAHRAAIKRGWAKRRAKMAGSKAIEK